MGHRSTSIRKRYISGPGLGLAVFAAFILYGMMAQPVMFAAMIHNIGYGFSWVFDQILWLSS